MTYEVQQTRWDRIIRRVSGSIGPGSRVSETLSELFPTLDVERVPAELLLLGGTRICFGGGIIQALAGNHPSASLFNPSDTGVIATVTAFVMTPGGATGLVWGATQTEQGIATGTEQFRDTRQPITERPACKVREREEVPVATSTNQASELGNVPLHLTDENSVIVLGPGTGLDMGLTSPASLLRYSFYWRERPAEEAELQF